MNTCQYCGTEFEPDKWHPNTKYCPPPARCRDLAHNERRRKSFTPEEPVDVDTQDLIKQLHKRGYFVSKEPISQDERFNVDVKRFDGDVRKFAVVSDTHLGSKYQQLSYLKSFYALCKDRGIKDVFHCGDLCEGNGRLYRGQAYEMFLLGADAQAEYVIKYYPREEGIRTYIIGGSHDYSFHKESGFDILKAVADEREDFSYLGMQGAYVNVENILIYLIHPSGGVSYARSYKLQKIIENFAPEQKPMIVFSGHYHVPNHLVGYRNVEGLQVGCFQAQTPYLKAKGLYPFLAGLFVDVTYDKTGLLSFKTEWFPFYIPVENDY